MSTTITDLFDVISKPISEMTDDELIEALGKLRELRKVRIGSGKQKDPLDLALAALSPEKAREIKEKLDAAILAEKQAGGTK